MKDLVLDGLFTCVGGRGCLDTYTYNTYIYIHIYIYTYIYIYVYIRTDMYTYVSNHMFKSGLRSMVEESGQLEGVCQHDLIIAIAEHLCNNFLATKLFVKSLP